MAVRWGVGLLIVAGLAMPAFAGAQVLPAPSEPPGEAAAVQAEPGQLLELQWNAPETCALGDRVRSEVQRLVPKDPQPTSSLRVIADVQQTALDNWHIDLRFSGSVHGLRSFESTSCDSLAHAAAVVIALAIKEEVEEPEPPPPPPPPPPPLPPPVVVPEPTPSPPPFSVGLGVELQTGLTPLVPGPIGVFAWQGNQLRTQLSLGWSPPTTKQSAQAGLSADLTLIWVSLGACGGQVASSLELFACAAYRLSWLSATGHGPGVQSQSGERAVHTVAPGILARVPLSTGLVLELGADVMVQLNRPSVVIVSEGAVNARYEIFAVSDPALSTHAVLAFAF